VGSKSVQPDVSQRTVRAATEEMTVFEEARALFEVIAETGKIYTVDLVGPACSCPDFEYRDDVEECKHIRRVRMAVGQVDLDALEAELERTASELETNAEQLERQAQDLHDEASSLQNAIDRLQEVRL
jgi:predicted nucleic acid-binding Zn finger protein